MTPTTPGRQQAPRVFDHFFSNSVGIGWKVESATPFERHISPEPEVLPPDAREMEQGHSGLRPFSHHLLDDFKIDAPDAPGDAASGSSTYSSLRGAPQHEPPAAEEVVRAPAPKRRLVAKNHDCEICAMRFPSASALARHVLTHTGVKPHACTWSECGKSFPSASALTQHVRVHTKEQPFACELPGCGKGFSQKINLKTHMDRHNGVTYRCDSCGKGGFTDTSNLSNHQTYRCGGEKKFPCEVCLVAFGSKFDLNRHKNTSKTHKEKVVEASKTHKRKAGEAFPSDA
ncbi:hypothetical protein T484DRAFT_1972016 [Baffinella frigidus]|nr:hypothetical protein T484DRAFT_1972016 [Cryptophyta sp. CCMP2293]